MNVQNQKPTVKIHVGPPKTGSSAIQNFLRSYANGSVVYPQIGQWHDGAHHNLVFNFFPNLQRPDMERIDIGSAFSEIGTQARAAGSDLIISSEILFSLDIRDFVDRLVEASRAQLADTEIILVYREPFARAASLYNQLVKDPVVCEKRTPSDFLLNTAHDLLYSPKIGQLADTGAQVKLINYEPRETFLSRFIQFLGIEVDSIENNTHNPSLSVPALIAILCANRARLSPEVHAGFIEALQKKPNFYAPSRYIFDEDSAQYAEALFHADQTLLKIEWNFEPTTIHRERNSFCLSRRQATEAQNLCAALPRDSHHAFRRELKAFMHD